MLVCLVIVQVESQQVRWCFSSLQVQCLWIAAQSSAGLAPTSASLSSTRAFQKSHDNRRSFEEFPSAALRPHLSRTSTMFFFGKGIVKDHITCPKRYLFAGGSGIVAKSEAHNV